MKILELVHRETVSHDNLKRLIGMKNKIMMPQCAIFFTSLQKDILIKVLYIFSNNRASDDDTKIVLSLS